MAHKRGPGRPNVFSKDDFAKMANVVKEHSLAKAQEIVRKWRGKKFASVSVPTLRKAAKLNGLNFVQGRPSSKVVRARGRNNYVTSDGRPCLKDGRLLAA